MIKGVAYLHDHQPAVVHGDLKPGNVIIDDSGHPRICDFGLAQIFYDEPGSGMTTTTEHTGTERYLAPELLIEEADTRPTAASDVYAVGCLGLEFIYLKRPYSHRKNNLRGVIYTDIKKGIPPAVDCDTQSSPEWSMIKWCWNRQPESRPLAFMMVDRLSTDTQIKDGATIIKPPSPVDIAHQEPKETMQTPEGQEKRKIDHMSGEGTTSDSMPRRRSTKLWGDSIEELQPAEFDKLDTTPKSPGGASKPEAMQWFKGKLLGEGTYGKVYLGFNATSGEMFAVKRVKMPDSRG